MTERPPTRVVIADDEPAVAEYLRLILTLEDSEFEVVAIVHDAGSAVGAVTQHEPDVLLLDLRMPGGGGLEAAQLVSALNPTTRVLVFTADADGADLLALLRSGISGYLTKSATSQEVVQAVRAVAAGRPQFVADIAAQAIGELRTRLHAERSDELRLEQARNRIERAIRTSAFRIVCQPVVDLEVGLPCGVEALSRFLGPADRTPDTWFADADLVDRRIDLELATARAALEALDSLASPLWLSINLSPTTVLSGELDRLLGGADLDRVVIELTEHAEVEDYGFLNVVLDRWRDRGIRVAVDDAGSGYASFAHVVKTRPDFIKLDRSLTLDIESDTRKQALAEAVSSFARRIGIDLIAEGIETEAQLELLREVGARFGQGFHLGRPVPLEDQPALVGAASPRPVSVESSPPA